MFHSPTNQPWFWSHELLVALVQNMTIIIWSACLFLHRTLLDEAAVKPWFIYTAWATVGLVGGLLILLYNLYPDRGLDAWVNRWGNDGIIIISPAIV
jgi:hypothetical protein